MHSIGTEQARPALAPLDYDTIASSKAKASHSAADITLLNLKHTTCTARVVLCYS